MNEPFEINRRSSSFCEVEIAKPHDIAGNIGSIAIGGAVYAVTLFAVLNFFILDFQFAIASFAMLGFAVPTGLGIGTVGGLISHGIVYCFNQAMSGYFSQLLLAVMAGGFTGYWSTAWILLAETTYVSIGVILRVFFAGPVLALMVGSFCCWKIVHQANSAQTKNANRPGQFKLRALFALTGVSAVFMAVYRVVPGTTKLIVLLVCYIFLQSIVVLSLHKLHLVRQRANNTQ